MFLIGINGIPLDPLASGHRETAPAAVLKFGVENLVVIGGIVRIVSAYFESEAGTILQGEIVHPGIDLLVCISGLVIACRPAVVVLIGDEAARVGYADIVLVVEVVLERRPEIVIPVFAAQLFVLHDVVYLSLQGMSGIKVHIFHILGVCRAVHRVESHFGRGQAEVAGYSAAVEILSFVVGAHFSLKRIVARVFQNDIDDRTPRMIFGRCAVHHFRFFHPVYRHVAQ